MRRILAMLLALVMLAPGVGLATDTGTASQTGTETEPMTVAQIALMNRPVSDTPTQITVGNNTPVSGEFFTDMWGNNTSDIDVRTLLHGYNTVVWSSQLHFVTDPMVVSEVALSMANRNAVYTITLQPDLVYCDGVTPITAKDYVFSLLMCTSPQLAELGALSTRYEQIVGYDAYHSGKAETLSGVRLLSDLRFSIAVKADHLPFFYDLSYIWCIPYPRSILAPYCDVVDSRKGAKLSNIDPEDPTVPFTVDILRQTIFNETDGYMHYPRLTSGPYALTAYDPETGRVDFALNPYFKGNLEGVRPLIDTLTLLPVAPETMVARLQSGEISLLNKCVEGKVITEGLGLRSEGFLAKNYARLGYGFCAFACEKGPQQFTAVRQAIAYCIDKEAFVRDYLDGFGMPVYGYYGMGQWMLLAAMGALRPEVTTQAELNRWDQITLDKLNLYQPDAEIATQLLIHDGWTLNAQGEPFTQGVDDVRYKKVDQTLMRLSLRFAQAEGNEGAEMIATQLQQALSAIGGELIVEIVPFSQLLADYYRSDGERKYDMNLMGSNFSNTFDPYYTFNTDESIAGAVNTSGLKDRKLEQLAWKMHKTEPMDLLTYQQNWLAFQLRFNELLPTLPLYSNVYFDFHTPWLHNYEPGSYASWATAIVYAYFAPPTEEVSLTVDEQTPQNTEVQPTQEAGETSQSVDETTQDTGEEIILLD